MTHDVYVVFFSGDPLLWLAGNPPRSIRKSSQNGEGSSDRIFPGGHSWNFMDVANSPYV